MNWPSNSPALSTFSNRTFRVARFLPFAAVIAFALLSIYSRIFHGPGLASEEISVHSLSILKNQRTYLISQSLVQGLSVDFIIFEAFIWIASIVALLRLLTGLFSAQALGSYRAKAEAYGKQRRSPAGLLFGLFVLGPSAILGSLHFEYASHST